MDWAAVEIPVDRDAILGIELLVDLGAHGVEDRSLGQEVPAPVGLVELVGTQFGRGVGVPDLERWTALRVVDADRHQRDRDRGEQHRCALQDPEHPSTASSRLFAT
jgi:hypothetical protein